VVVRQVESDLRAADKLVFGRCLPESYPRGNAADRAFACTPQLFRLFHRFRPVFHTARLGGLYSENTSSMRADS